MTNAEFLVALADQLDKEDKHELADIVDKDFEELLTMLENGELTFNDQSSGGQRDPRLPYSNRGSETPIFGV
jgi:hypothetical protein